MLGPGHESSECFGEGLRPGGGPLHSRGAWHNFFLLDEKVKLFSVLTLEAVLHSRDLRMYSENSTFTLAYWWCRLQPDNERQAFFTRLLEGSLFSNRMSSDFLGSVVALCSP